MVSPSEWGEDSITVVRVGSGWYHRHSGVRVVSPWYHCQSGVGVVSPSEWGQGSITVVSQTEWGRSGITVRVGSGWCHRQSGVRWYHRQSESGWYHLQSGVRVVSPSEWGRNSITVRGWYHRQSGVRVVSPSEWGQSGITIRVGSGWYHQAHAYYMLHGVQPFHVGQTEPCRHHKETTEQNNKTLKLRAEHCAMYINTAPIQAPSLQRISKVILTGQP